MPEESPTRTFAETVRLHRMSCSPFIAIGVALLGWLCPKLWNYNKKEGKSEGQHRFHEMDLDSVGH